MNSSPVYVGNLPPQYILSDRPKCINRVLTNEINYSIGSIPTGLSQLSSISQSNNDLFEDSTSSNNTKRSVYSFLIASFKELCSIYESNSDKEELLQIRSYFEKQILNKKKEIFHRKNISKDSISKVTSSIPVGTYISSSINSSKKRKTHGTKYFDKK